MSNVFAAQQEIIDKLIAEITGYPDIADRVFKIALVDELLDHLQFTPSISVMWQPSGGSESEGKNANRGRENLRSMTWVIWLAIHDSQRPRNTIDDAGELLFQIQNILLGFKPTDYTKGFTGGELGGVQTPDGIPLYTITFTSQQIIRSA